MDHTDTGLRACIKSLIDVIAPAIDPSDPLAAEQLKLVAHYLEFLRGRFEYIHDRERFDVAHHLAIGRAILATGAPDSPEIAQLQTAVAAATDRLGAAQTSTRELKGHAAELAACIAAVVDVAHNLEAFARQRIERCVVDAMDDRVDFERAWYLPLGLDPQPDTAPSLDSVCDAIQDGVDAQ